MDPMLLWGLGLLALSVLILVIEIFVPSGGMLAITSGVVGIAGIVCLFLMKEQGTLWGSAGILMMLIVFPSAFALWIKVIPSTRFGQRMMGVLPEDEITQREQLEREAHELLESLVGQEGVAKSALRPVGTIEIDEERYDALAEGVAIEPGQKVRVSAIVNAQIKVRPIS
ncbi:MAG: NfeD family protein [Phycisphaerales bacterium JB058]